MTPVAMMDSTSSSAKALVVPTNIPTSTAMEGILSGLCTDDYT